MFVLRGTEGGNNSVAAIRLTGGFGMSEATVSTVLGQEG